MCPVYPVVAVPCVSLKIYVVVVDITIVILIYMYVDNNMMKYRFICSCFGRRFPIPDIKPIHASHVN